ncbi:MAG: hypothetical protein GF313_03335 [Caldithrix sp.]|nr:hypothetical protein [Caldithrix sp.]
MPNQFEDVQRILTGSRRELLAKRNVVATGIGYKITNGKTTDELSIICSVDRKKSKQQLSATDLVPDHIDNIPTDVFPTGPIYALQARTDKWRPAPGGVSIGHINITAGTLGCLVQRDGIRMILSNNHVIANSNDADIGDPIVQPGPTDGGQYPQDHIANLSDFIPIQFEGDGNGNGNGICSIAKSVAAPLNALAMLVGSKTKLYPKRQIAGRQAEENLVDCAIAQPLDDNDVKNEILELGKISGITEGTLGMDVTKSGRTTQVTSGTITQVDVTVQVSYGSDKIATFVDQLMTGNMSAGGDSGSAVLNTDNEIVGLLFAGSSSSTIINRIQNVFSALNIGLIDE